MEILLFSYTQPPLRRNDRLPAARRHRPLGSSSEPVAVCRRRRRAAAALCVRPSLADDDSARAGVLWTATMPSLTPNAFEGRHRWGLLLPCTDVRLIVRTLCCHEHCCRYPPGGGVLRHHHLGAPMQYESHPWLIHPPALHHPNRPLHVVLGTLVPRIPRPTLHAGKSFGCHGDVAHPLAYVTRVALSRRSQGPWCVAAGPSAVGGLRLDSGGVSGGHVQRRRHGGAHVVRQG